MLDQVLELLRQRGPVTYNALERQFGLDDACLQDLTNEIIEALTGDHVAEVAAGAKDLPTGRQVVVQRPTLP